MSERGPALVETAVWILLAAGFSTRYGGRRSKLLEPLGSGRVLDVTLASLKSALPQAPILLVSTPDLRDAIGWSGPWTEGGKRRQDSAANGVAAALALVPPTGGAPTGIGAPTIGLIHDAARPFVSRGLVADVLAALENPAVAGAAPALPVTNTIKRARNGEVIETLPRDELVALQTPQAVRLSVATTAFAQARDYEGTDDLAILEAAKYRTRVTKGDPRNIKITTPDDLSRAAAILASWTS